MFFGDHMFTIINNIVWAVATTLILISSIYFTYKLDFVQFKFKKMFKSLFQNKHKNNGISPIQTLMLSLGGRIGVGSIAGIALAIYLGGPGTIFWMWIMSFLTVSNTFSETVLGNIYKQKEVDGVYKGGPSYYLKYGCHNKLLGSIYAIIILISYVGGFISIQSNTITRSVNEVIIIEPYIIGIIICIITCFIIFGGIKKILMVSGKMIPFMAILYLLSCLIILCMNINYLPGILEKIVVSAFNFKSFFSGFIPTFIIGLQRGIFSNEAGLGTGSIASSATSDNDSVKQGYIQVIGIYVSMLICTFTAFVVMLIDLNNINYVNVNGIEIVQNIFKDYLGNIGLFIMLISIILFSFSTVITGYYYGETSLKYFFEKPHKTLLFMLKILTIIILFLGSIMSSKTLWAIVDFLIAFLAIINIYGLLKLRYDIKTSLDKSLKK